MRRKFFFTLVLLVTLLPLWMWLAWLLTPKKKLVTAIVDKTVMSQEGREHASLTWILNHQKFTKTPSQHYTVSNDYFGFFPLTEEKFRIKGLERFSPNQIDQLSKDCDVAYFADMYGVYTNEWFAKTNITERSGIIYGGMSQQDIDFLKKMKERRKLIVTEFNTIGSPTPDAIRNQFQQLFGIEWSGWIGKFFNSFDTSINKEIPAWLIHTYAAQHNGKWPFKLSGIAFVSNDDKVVILEEGQHLNDPLPYIETGDYAQNNLELPESMKYSFWFDIVNPDTSRNEVIAEFNLAVNKKGAAELAQNGIPSIIPAVTMHKGNDYEFYYFSGDFCDNPISLTSSYFKGISSFQSFFYKPNDILERESFFWRFYKPMVTKIFTDYYKRKN
jgi:hypothetical protein